MNQLTGSFDQLSNSACHPSMRQSSVPVPDDVSRPASRAEPGEREVHPCGDGRGAGERDDRPTPEPAVAQHDHRDTGE